MTGLPVLLRKGAPPKGVHAGLVSFALRFQPVENVDVQAHIDAFLWLRHQEFGALPEAFGGDNQNTELSIADKTLLAVVLAIIRSKESIFRLISNLVLAVHPRVSGASLRLNSDQFAVDPGQPDEVLHLRQHLCLESLQPGGQRRASFPSLL